MNNIQEIKTEIENYEKISTLMIQSEEHNRPEVMKLFTNMCLLSLKVSNLVNNLLKSRNTDQKELSESIDLKCKVAELMKTFELLTR